MMRGTGKAYCTHVPHSSTPHPGPWDSRMERSPLKQREEQCCRCSLIYKGAHFKDGRRIRPLFLPPRPRRNQYTPSSLPSAALHGVWERRGANCPPLWVTAAFAPATADAAAGALLPWNQTFSGSGYSTPKVSTLTFFITWGMRGLSFQSVRTSQMRSTASTPSMTLPKAA